MALRILPENEKARMVGRIFWMEDLEREGLTYGDLVGFLFDSGLKGVCSPIHGKDTYTAEDVRRWHKRNDDKIADKETGEIAPENVDKIPKVGDLKKAHVHVYLICKGGKFPKDWAKPFVDFMPLDSTRWAKVEDWDWAVDYTWHKNNPEKAQYNPEDSIAFGGADVSSLWEPTKEDKNKALRVVNQYIRENHITYYHVLDTWAQTQDLAIQNVVFGRNSYFVAKFNSMRAERADKEKAAKKEN